MLTITIKDSIWKTWCLCAKKGESVQQRQLSDSYHGCTVLCGFIKKTFVLNRQERLSVWGHLKMLYLLDAVGVCTDTNRLLTTITSTNHILYFVLFLNWSLGENKLFYKDHQSTWTSLALESTLFVLKMLMWIDFVGLFILHSRFALKHKWTSLDMVIENRCYMLSY